MNKMKTVVITEFENTPVPADYTLDLRTAEASSQSLPFPGTWIPLIDFSMLYWPYAE